MSSLKIISGGQTGVDSAALDWAITNGVPHGGYCPKGRKSEDGVIPLKYNLVETSTDKYPQRTEFNVKAAKMTLIIVPYEGYKSRGCALTEKLCIKWNVPYWVIPADQELSLADRGRIAGAYPGRTNYEVYNVAGPRLSNWPEATLWTHRMLDKLFLYLL